MGRPPVKSVEDKTSADVPTVHTEAESRVHRPLQDPRRFRHIHLAGCGCAPPIQATQPAERSHSSSASPISGTAKATWTVDDL